MNQLKITRKFVLGSAFEKAWKSLGFKDEDLRRLQKELLQNPKVGDVIRGTGRLRKMRFAFEHRGKSGSTRICYVDFEAAGTIVLLTVFSKNEQESLSQAECLMLKKLINNIEKSL